jgi:hypothetical protein
LDCPEITIAGTGYRFYRTAGNTKFWPFYLNESPTYKKTWPSVQTTVPLMTISPVLLLTVTLSIVKLVISENAGLHIRLNTIAEISLFMIVSIVMIQNYTNIPMITFGSPAFRLYGIRNFLSLPYNKFSVE